MKRSVKRFALAAAIAGFAGAAHAAECTAELATAGEDVFKACAVCHKVEDGKNGVGPHLFGALGREIASVDKFRYSKGMQSYGEEHGAWTHELMSAYLENPRTVVKGTRMAYPGLKDAADRDAVICYIEANSG